MTQAFFHVARIATAAALGLGAFGIAPAAEPGMSGHHHAVPVTPPSAFVASRDKPYGALVDDAMAIMNNGMAHAPMTGDADHDFASMMVPHHQGAVDMAKVELQFGNDPLLLKLARAIVESQTEEIAKMTEWKAKHAK